MSATLDRYRQLRVGGLSSSVLSELASTGLSEWYLVAHSAHQHLRLHRDAISEALHAVIAHTETESRKKMVSFRRGLYNGSWARAYHSFQSLDLELHESVLRAIPKTIEQLDAWVNAQSSLDAHFDDWMTDERARLLHCAEDGALRRGMTIAAPALVPALQRLRTNNVARRFDKKDKRTHRSLLSYALRAAAKTSPYSSLGPIAVITSEPTAPSTRGADTYGSRWSVYPVARVFNALIATPERLEQFPVRISPYVENRLGSVFVNRTRWHFREVPGGNDYAQCEESAVFINQRTVTDAVSASLAEAATTIGGLSRQLQEDKGLSPSDANALITTLLRLGFIQVDELAIHPHSTSEIEATLLRIEATEHGRELAGVLRNYCELAESFSSLERQKDRLEVLTALRGQIERAYAIVGIDAPTPRSVVYEDVLLSSGSVEAEEVPLSGEDLTQLATFLDLFDLANIRQDLMRGFFLHRWGADGVCDNVLQFIVDFEEQLLNSFEGYDVTAIATDDLADDPWLTWGEAWRWVAAQRALATEINTHVVRGPLGQASSVVGVKLDQALQSAAAMLARKQPSFRHLNILCQRADDHVVLNDSFGAVGFPVSRFSHLFSTDVKNFTADAEESARSANVRLAELGGGALFSNLNAHAPVLRTEIVVAGDPASSGGLDKLVLDDLRVRYSAAQNRVVLEIKETGEEVHPHYPGYLIAGATPRHHQVLALFTPTANYSRRPYDLMTAEPLMGEVLRSPRISIGAIVVARARTLIRASDFPTNDPLTPRVTVSGQNSGWTTTFRVAATSRSPMMHRTVTNRRTSTSPLSAFATFSCRSCGR